jgi:hypothetical protein
MPYSCLSTPLFWVVCVFLCSMSTLKFWHNDIFFFCKLEDILDPAKEQKLQLS